MQKPSQLPSQPLNAAGELLSFQYPHPLHPGP